jgi:uncharacterized protein YkwD
MLRTAESVAPRGVAGGPGLVVAPRADRQGGLPAPDVLSISATTTTTPPTTTTTVVTATSTTVRSSSAMAAHTATPMSSVVPVPVPADQVLALVNQHRAEAGCRPVRNDARLADAAGAHSAEMAGLRTLDHESRDGSGPGERIAAAGYPWAVYGENVAVGQPTAPAVVAAWMNSPGHRANILNCAFEDMGLGVVYSSKGTAYWTQDFATRR